MIYSLALRRLGSIPISLLLTRRTTLDYRSGGKAWISKSAILTKFNEPFSHRGDRGRRHVRPISWTPGRTHITLRIDTMCPLFPGVWAFLFSYPFCVLLSLRSFLVLFFFKADVDKEILLDWTLFPIISKENLKLNWIGRIEENNSFNNGTDSTNNCKSVHPAFRFANWRSLHKLVYKHSTCSINLQSINSAEKERSYEILVILRYYWIEKTSAKWVVPHILCMRIC